MDNRSREFSVKPLVQVLFFLLLTTYMYNRVFHIGINLYLSDFIVMAIMALSVIQMVGRNQIYQYRRFIFLFALLFLYYVFLIFYSYALLGNSINDVFGRFRNLFFYPLLFFAGLVFTRGKADMNRYLGMIKIYLVIAVGIGMAGLVYPSLRMAKIYARDEAGAAVVEPLYYMIVEHGTTLLCGLIVIHQLLYLLKKPKNILKPVFFVTVGLIGIIGSQNRSIYIVLLLSFFLMGWYTRKTERKIKARAKTAALFLILLLAGSIVVLIYSPLYEKFQDRIDETINTFTGEKEFFNSITGVRLARTLITFNAWWKTPVLGCGWGNQITEYDIYDFQGNYVRTSYGTPHNYYLTILYQTGIIGFVIMIFILSGIYRALKPANRLTRENTTEYTLFIFYLVFLVFNVANTHLYGHPVFIPLNFFLWGAAVSYSFQLKNE
ncbi:MAG: O-antigen ligase family protein [Candidatus Aminicenantes bacterium]|jgi:O-antigen ligase